MRREESWMLQEVLIKKTEISLLIHSIEKSTNNGTSFMQMNGRDHQRRESSMKISVYM
jgi:hypothetical protein